MVSGPELSIRRLNRTLFVRQSLARRTGAPTTRRQHEDAAVIRDVHCRWSRGRNMEAEGDWIAVTPFAPLPRRWKRSVEDEAEALASFHRD